MPECSVCFEDDIAPPTHHHRHEPLCSCSHAFCRPCLIRWVDTCERQQSATPTRPACPTCRQLINDWDLIRIVGRPFRPPARVIPPSDEEDALFLAYLKEQGARSCPKCHIWILRSMGCNRMSCCRCKTSFCYGCGKIRCECSSSYNYDNNNNNDAGDDDYFFDDYSSYDGGCSCCSSFYCQGVSEQNEDYDSIFVMEGLKRGRRTRSQFGVVGGGAATKRSAKDKQKRKTKTVNRKNRQSRKDATTERIESLVCGIDGAFQKTKDWTLREFKISIDRTSEKLSNGDIGVEKFCADAMMAMWETERKGKATENFPVFWGGAIACADDYIACLDLATLHRLDYGPFVEEVLVLERRKRVKQESVQEEAVVKHGDNKHGRKKGNHQGKARNPMNRSAKKKQFHREIIFKE